MERVAASCIQEKKILTEKSILRNFLAHLISENYHKCRLVL